MFNFAMDRIDKVEAVMREGSPMNLPALIDERATDKLELSYANLAMLPTCLGYLLGTQPAVAGGGSLVELEIRIY